MDGFTTWDILKEYASFVAIVFITVEFLKELKFIKKIPTKYFSAIISFILLVLVNLNNGNYQNWDIVLYILSSISISMGANGVSNFNKKTYRDSDII